MKRYRLERGSLLLDALFGELLGDEETLASSLLTVLELSAAAQRLLRGAVIRPTRHQALLAALREGSVQRVTLQPITDQGLI